LFINYDIFIDFNPLLVDGGYSKYGVSIGWRLKALTGGEQVCCGILNGAAVRHVEMLNQTYCLFRAQLKIGSRLFVLGVRFVPNALLMH
jgi:hypothetical protein